MSAVANAQDRGRLDPMDLRVVESFVDEGWTLKRYRPVSRGRGHAHQKALLTHHG